jgi:predicted ATPase
VLHEQWVNHLRTAIKGLKTVEIWEREEDKHLVLQAQFEGLHSAPVPSWFLSDGTLRLMALTLLSFGSQADDREIYLIEEPENGLHPLAIQAAYEVLCRPPPEVQLFFATHSPVFLAHVGMEDVLVFRRHANGYAIVRHGDEVPDLRDWQGRHSIAELFVTGVLS